MSSQLLTNLKRSSPMILISTIFINTCQKHTTCQSKDTQHSIHIQNQVKTTMSSYTLWPNKYSLSWNKPSVKTSDPSGSRTTVVDYSRKYDILGYRLPSSFPFTPTLTLCLFHFKGKYCWVRPLLLTWGHY